MALLVTRTPVDTTTLLSTYYVDAEEETVQTEEYGLCALTDGWVDFDYTGLKDGYAFTDGKVDTSVSGIFLYGSDEYYFVDGQVLDYTGIKNTVLLSDGIVDKDYNGIYEEDGTKYYIVSGRVSSDTFGVEEIDGIQYLVQNGVVSDDTGIVSMVSDDSKSLYCLNDGIIDTSCSEFVEYEGEWYYIKDGKTDEVDGVFHGTVQGTEAGWCVMDGKVQLSYCGIMWCNGNIYSVLDGQTTLYSPTIDNIAMTYRDGSQEMADHVNSVLVSELPDILLQKFINSGHVILVSNIREIDNGTNWIAVYNYTNGIMYVLDSPENDISDCVVHEFGHYVDCESGWASHAGVFERIYEEEYENFISYFKENAQVAVNCTTEEEYFAEAFRIYYSDYDLYSVCPKTAYYIENTISSFLYS